MKDECPDCHMPWPDGEPQCSNCGLDIEDVESGAAFFDKLIKPKQ